MPNLEVLTRHNEDPIVKKTSAFNLEYLNNTTDEGILAHTIAYLAEYRFAVSNHSYELKLSGGNIADPYTGEDFGLVLKRTIDERTAQGLSVSREAAELDGKDELNKQLKKAKSGDMVFWASPPGPESEGYGDYGYLYVGRINGDIENGKIDMVAIMVEKPEIENFNNAMKMLTGVSNTKQTPEDFLASPEVIERSYSEEEIDRIIKLNFVTPPEKNLDNFNNALINLKPLIPDFTLVVRSGTAEEKKKAFYSLENYALELKRKYNQPNSGEIYLNSVSFLQVVDKYGHKPPVVGGSCGTTGSGESNNIFANNSIIKNIFLEDKYGSRTFECPSCGKTNVRPENELLSSCQHCGSNKVACDDNSPSYALAA